MVIRLESAKGGQWAAKNPWILQYLSDLAAPGDIAHELKNAERKCCCSVVHRAEMA